MPGLVLGQCGGVPEAADSPPFGFGLCSGCLSLAGWLLRRQLSDALRQSGVVSLLSGKELGLWNQTSEAQIQVQVHLE